MSAETQDPTAVMISWDSSPWGLYSPACPGLCNCAISPTLGQASRPLTEVCSRWQLRTESDTGSRILFPRWVAHTFQHTWAASVTGVMEGFPAQSPTTVTALRRGCVNICETHGLLDSFRSALPLRCWRHLAQTFDFIFKPRRVFSKKATTIFSGTAV